MRILRKYKEYFLFLFFYFVSYGFILINNGLYWDDWCIQSPSACYEIFNHLGFFLIWPYYIHKFCLSFPSGALLERFLIFFSFLGAGIFLNLILKKIKDISEIDRLFIVLFFLLFPINSCRITLATIQYSISFFLFYFAFWLSVLYLENKKNLILRILSLVLFFISFSTGSFLFFYCIPMLYIFLKDGFKFDKKILITFKNYIFNYWDYFLLPILFVIIKNYFFQPTHLYAAEKYNSLNLMMILFSPKYFLDSLFHSFRKLIDLSFLFFFQKVSFSFFIISFCFIYKFFVKDFRNDINLKNINKFILIGIFLSYVGAFPYIAVGKVPDIGRFYSRHQLLLGLGFSFILVYGIQYFVEVFFKFNKKILIYIYVFFSFIFSFYNLKIYSDWYKETLKTKSIILQIKNSEIIKNTNTFIIQDLSDQYVKDYRRIYYEYTGIFKKIFNDETRLAFDDSEKKELNYYKQFVPYFAYSMTEYKGKAIDYKITIRNKKNYLNNNFLFLKNMFYRFFNKQKFDENLKNLVIFEYEKLG